MAIANMQPQQQRSGLGLALGNLGSSLFGTGLGFIQQNRANKFNLDMWRRQNEFNSPSAQMKRLKDAGLNPNLIYGNSSAGAAGTASNAPQFERLADNAYRPVDINSSIQSLQSFTDWDIKKATESKLIAETKNKEAETLLKIADTSKRELESGKLKEEKPYWGKLASLSTDALAEQVKKTVADTQYTKNQDRRTELTTQVGIVETLQRIDQMKSGIKLNTAQIAKLVEDTRLQKWYTEMTEKGWDPRTPWFIKKMSEVVQDLQFSSPGTKKKKFTDIPSANNPRIPFPMK